MTKCWTFIREKWWQWRPYGRVNYQSMTSEFSMNKHFYGWSSASFVGTDLISSLILCQLPNCTWLLHKLATVFSWLIWWYETFSYAICALLRVLVFTCAYPFLFAWRSDWCKIHQHTTFFIFLVTLAALKYIIQWSITAWIEYNFISFFTSDIIVKMCFVSLNLWNLFIYFHY